MGLLVLVMLTLILLATEFYLRHVMRQYFQQASQQMEQQHNLLIHRRSRDPALVYELTPGASTTRDGILYQINDQGFRDDAFDGPTSKTSNEFRIVVMGDSVAWGWGVKMEEAWPQRLEQALALAIPDRKITVYNLAVNGYSTQQEARLLETKGLAYDPDLVIVNYALNDPTIEEGGMWPYFAPITRLETWYRSKMVWQGLRNTALDYLGQLPSPFPHNNPWDHTTLIHGALFHQVETGMQQLSTLQQNRPIKILWLVTPLFDFKKNQPYPWENIHRLLLEKCRQYDFAYVDIQPHYADYNSKKLAVDLIHPNALGHAIIADVMMKKIMAENLPARVN